MFFAFSRSSIPSKDSAASVRAALAALTVFAWGAVGCDFSSSSPECIGTDIDQSTVIPVEDGAVWIYRMAASDSSARRRSSQSEWVVYQIDSVLHSTTGTTFRFRKFDSLIVSGQSPLTGRDTTYAAKSYGWWRFGLRGDSLLEMTENGSWETARPSEGWPLQFTAIADSADSSGGRIPDLRSSVVDRKTLRSVVTYGDSARERSAYSFHLVEEWCSTHQQGCVINERFESSLNMTWVSGVGYLSFGFQSSDSLVDEGSRTTKKETAELVFQGNLRTGSTRLGAIPQDIKPWIESLPR